MECAATGGAVADHNHAANSLRPARPK